MSIRRTPFSCFRRGTSARHRTPTSPNPCNDRSDDAVCRAPVHLTDDIARDARAPRRRTEGCATRRRIRGPRSVLLQKRCAEPVPCLRDSGPLPCRTPLLPSVRMPRAHHDDVAPIAVRSGLHCTRTASIVEAAGEGTGRGRSSAHLGCTWCATEASPASGAGPSSSATYRASSAVSAARGTHVWAVCPSCSRNR